MNYNTHPYSYNGGIVYDDPYRPYSGVDTSTIDTTISTYTLPSMTYDFGSDITGFNSKSRNVGAGLAEMIKDL